MAFKWGLGGCWGLSGLGDQLGDGRVAEEYIIFLILWRRRARIWRNEGMPMLWIGGVKWQAIEDAVNRLLSDSDDVIGVTSVDFVGLALNIISIYYYGDVIEAMICITPSPRRLARVRPQAGYCSCGGRRCPWRFGWSCLLIFLSRIVVLFPFIIRVDISLKP